LGLAWSWLNLRSCSKNPTIPPTIQNPWPSSFRFKASVSWCCWWDLIGFFPVYNKQKTAITEKLCLAFSNHLSVKMRVSMWKVATVWARCSSSSWMWGLANPQKASWCQ
jgi:hypothetical protein